MKVVFRRIIGFLAIPFLSFELCLSLGAQEGPILKLTDSGGREIEARIIALDEGAVTIERADGRLFYEIPLSKFSKKSQEKITASFAEQEESRLFPDLTEDADLKVRFSSGRDDDLNDTGDPDNRSVVLQPSVGFENTNFTETYRDIECTVYIIGKSVLSSDEYKILNKQDFTVTIPPRESVRWESKPFNNLYDDYAKNGSAFGYKYDDYLLVLRNRSGEPVLVYSARKHFEKVAENIFKASLSKSYDEDFEKEVPESRV